MTVLFLISLAVILYTYAGYPILIALLARIRPRPWLRAPYRMPGAPSQTASSFEAGSTNPPPISIVMAVHNGAAMLPAQLDHLLWLEPELVREIIVVSDGSTDRTDRILLETLLQDVPHSSRFHRDEWIHYLARLKPILLPTQGGKTAAVNAGVAAAKGDILLFVDIRPRIEAGALASLLANFADPRVGCVAGELLLGTAGHDATASAVSGLYWRYEQWIRNCEALVDSPVGVYGGFYAIRRELAVPAPAGLILDDMFQPLAIIRQGYRSVVDREALVTDRWPAKAGGEFSRKVRTLAGNFQLIAEAPWVLSPTNRVLFQLISHKLLRLVVPYFFVTLFLSSALLGDHSRFCLVFAYLQLAFWLMAAVAVRHRIPLVQRIAGPASALLVLNAAAVVGLYTWLFTRGPLWRIWSPTAAPSPDSDSKPTDRQN
jgi:glycosyltransferase involved in cell wall biosynthesis